MKRLPTLALLTLLAACDSGSKSTTPTPATPLPTASSPTTPPATPTPTASSTTSPTMTPTATGSNDPKSAPDPSISISGVVKFNGTAPKRGKEKSVKDNPDCGAQYSDEKPLLKDELIVNEGKIQNVMVYVKQGLEGRRFPAPAETVVVGQKGCHYAPHVFGLVAGQKLQVKNDDNTKHNVHPLPKLNTLDPENPMQGPGVQTTWTLQTPEGPFFVKCDVHSWMGGWGWVFSHPYFSISGEDGAFSLKGLPPGTYVIEAWHEKLGTTTQSVTVKAGEAKTIEFAFEGK